MTTIDEGSADVESELDVIPVEVGEGASVNAEGGMAVGGSAVANAEDTVALGDDAQAERPELVVFGQRDIELADARSILFPPDQGSQVLADVPITDDAPEGQSHNVLITAAGEALVEHRVEADGKGGVQNKTVYIPADLAVEGDVREVDDVVTGSVNVDDPDGNTQILLDATTTPPTLDFNGNDLLDVNLIDPTGGELFIDGDVTISGELTEGASF